MNGDKPLYRPTHVTDGNGWDTIRGSHRTKQVHYQMSDGSKSYVEVPHDEYTPERVQEELDKAAIVHAQVMGTTPGSGIIPLTPTGNPWNSGS